MRQPRAVNPFYVASLPVGVLFAVTACAYCVLTIRGRDPHFIADSGFIAWLNTNGLVVMIGEIVTLGVLTVMAIASDDFWSRRFERRQQRHR
jgi:hypothetical protein